VDDVRRLRGKAGVTQSALAEAAGTSQPAIAAYEAGRKSPTLRTLRRLASAVGLEASVEFHPPLTREERRSLALHRAVGERLAARPGPALRRARRDLARMKEALPGAASLLREWEVLLERRPGDQISALTDPSLRARPHREVTPFVGALSPSERAEVYRSFEEEEGEGPRGSPP
jgi:transcriptional regulator with XRE-family HTH domain